VETAKRSGSTTRATTSPRNRAQRAAGDGKAYTHTPIADESRHRQESLTAVAAARDDVLARVRAAEADDGCIRRRRQRRGHDDDSGLGLHRHHDTDTHRHTDTRGVKRCDTHRGAIARVRTLFSFAGSAYVMRTSWMALKPSPPTVNSTRWPRWSAGCSATQARPHRRQTHKRRHASDARVPRQTCSGW
jgi:hypothetical protein